MKITKDLESKVRELLGGKNITTKRVESLLSELEQRRTGVLEITPVDAGVIDTEITHEPPVMVSVPITEPTPSEPLSREAVAAQMREGILQAEIAQLKLKMADMARGKDPEELDQAIGAGRVPPVVTPAPDGYAKLPRGQWFNSPFGQHYPAYKCDCGTCKDSKELHFYCVVCKSGPHLITSAKPIFKRSYMAPGDLWGVTHYTCPGPCTMQFMGMLGQGVAAMPGGPMMDAPMMPVRTADPVMPAPPPMGSD